VAARLIDGTAVARQVREDVAEKVAELSAAGGRRCTTLEPGTLNAVEGAWAASGASARAGPLSWIIATRRPSGVSKAQHRGCSSRLPLRG
jgi:hypothetical protein